MKERAYEIDVMKGIGILLVILGHCTPDFPVNITEDACSMELRKFIYTFHMPMFFFCSGFVLGLVPSKPIGDTIKNRFTRLMIPYITFSLVNLALRVIFSSITRSQVDFVETLKGVLLYGEYYWFVYALFFLMILMALARRNKWVSTAYVIIGIYLYYLYIPTFCLREIGYYMLYAVAGLFLSKYRSHLKDFMNNYWVPVGLSILLVQLFILTPPENFIPRYLNKVAMAFAGIFVLYGFAVHPIKSKKITDTVNHFGKYSLQYYMIHELTSLPCYYAAPILHLKANVGTMIIFFILITITSYVVLRILLLNKWCYKFIGIK